jgi:O-antigen biosynthesis protein
MDGLPICVLGIRSGSSLATRALVALGADPGTESELLPAVADDNPKGYWEQQPMITLNDDLLAHLGGPWWDLPELPEGWHEDPALEPFRERARRLIAELFPSDRQWVWKDPRAALTLPFWQDVIGPMRYVVSVRSPGDVAASLQTRDPLMHPWLESTRVYFRYVHASLMQTVMSDRIVIFYDDWFDGFDAQLDRLAKFATGSYPVSDARDDLRDFFESGLRHHDKRSAGDGLDPETNEAFRALREGTGADARLDVSAEGAVHAQWQALKSRLADAGMEELRERTRAVWRYAHEQQRAREAEVRAHADTRRAGEEALADARTELEQANHWLEDVNTSLSWRLTSPLRKVKRNNR